MVSTTNIQVVNLLVNDDFINYVINPNLALSEMWNDFFSLHPEIIPHAVEAKKILLGDNITDELSATEVKELESRIMAIAI